MCPVCRMLQEHDDNDDDDDVYILLICGNKMPTRCNRGFYCRSYCLLNMFRAPLCPSLGAQEYYTVVSPNLQITFYIFTARNTTRSNHCITLLSS